MKLKSLSTLNFQGQNISDSLGDVTIYVGPPFRGKTTRKNAATFLLLGYVPSLGKLPSASAQLASGSPMFVQSECDTGMKISRSLERKGKSWSAAVSESMPTVPPVLLSPGVFFEMGPTERTKFVFSRVKLDEKEFSTDAIVNLVMGVNLPEGQENKDILEEIVTELRNESDTRDAQEEHRDPATPTIQDWLAAQISIIRDRLKNAKAAVKRYIGHEQTSEEMEVKHGGAVSRSGPEIQDDINRVNELLQSANQKRGEIVAKRKAQSDWRDQKKKLADVVNDPAAAHLAGLLADTRATRDRLQEIVLDFVSATPALEAEKRTLLPTVRELETTIADCEQKLLNPETRLTIELEGKISTLRNSLKIENNATRQLETKLALDLKKPCCPVCASEGDEFVGRIKKLHQKAVNDVLGKITTIDSDIAASEASLKAEKERIIASLTTTNSDAKAKLEKLSAELGQIEQKLIPCRAHDVTHQDNRKKLQKLNLEVGEFNTQVEAFDNAKSGLANLSPEDEADYGPILEAVDMEIEESKQSLIRFQQELRDLGAAEASAQRRAQAEQDRLNAKADEVVTDLVAEKLAEIQSKAISASISPVLTVANRFASGLLKSPLDFADGEFGRRENGQWISHAVFSGFEQLMAFAGISVALASGDSPFKIVMMDELGRMDTPTKLAVITRIQELIAAGVIEQFIGIDVTPVPYDQIPGVKVINV